MEQADQGISEGKRVSRWRWWFHLTLLTFYPIALGVILPLLAGDQRGTLLPASTKGLLIVSAGELAIFGAIFLSAWFLSKATREQLLLRWRGGMQTVWRGFVCSILLRMAIAVIMVMIAIAAALAGGASQELLQRLRPRTEVVVEPEVLQTSPIYFVLMLTLISFVVAGFREELWRAGVLAGLRELWPRRFGDGAGQIVAVSFAAVVFGLGHMPQGLGGAAVTAFLGFGLGVIMVRYQSIWEAVLAHGFFNATTFVMLYWLARNYPELIPGQ